MRVNEYRIGSGAGDAGQTERAGEAREGSASARSGMAGGGIDRVAVSGLAGRLAGALGANGEKREARILELTAAFDGGTLDAEPGRLSRALLASMQQAA